MLILKWERLLKLNAAKNEAKLTDKPLTNYTINYLFLMCSALKTPKYSDPLLRFSSQI